MFDGPSWLRRSLARFLAARFPCCKWGKLARRLLQRGSVGSLRSNADGNENVKNNRFYKQNNNFAPASRVFVRLRRENA